MGSGAFDKDKFYGDVKKMSSSSQSSSTSSYRTGSTTSTSSSYLTSYPSYLSGLPRGMPEGMDPRTIDKRKSLASAEHPDPTSIIIACDNTGSMGKIPKNLFSRDQKGALPEMFDVMKARLIPDPQIAFLAVGDSKSDKAPLQVSQFESDNRCVKHLESLWLEANGGANGGESYHLVWYFAAEKTELSSHTVGKKGIIITIGDEKVHDVLTADEIRKFIDPNYTGTDLNNNVLLNMIRDKWEVCHVFVEQGSNSEAREQWCSLLGEDHVYSVIETSEVANAIGALVTRVYPKLAMSSEKSSTITLALGTASALPDNNDEEIYFSFELAQDIQESYSMLERQISLFASSGRSIETKKQAEIEFKVVKSLQDNFPFTKKAFKLLGDEMDRQHPSWRSTSAGALYERAEYEVNGNVKANEKTLSLEF